MSELVRITVPGRPVAKQRPRRGRGSHWYTPPATREYENLVAWTCRATGFRLGEIDVGVELELWVRRRRGDLDNYAKSVLDGMVKGGVLEDDRQVVHLSTKFVTVFGPADERVVIVIDPLPQQPCQEEL